MSNVTVTVTNKKHARDESDEEDVQIITETETPVKKAKKTQKTEEQIKYDAIRDEIQAKINVADRDSAEFKTLCVELYMAQENCKRANENSKKAGIEAKSNWFLELYYTVQRFCINRELIYICHETGHVGDYNKTYERCEKLLEDLAEQMDKGYEYLYITLDDFKRFECTRTKTISSVEVLEIKNFTNAWAKKNKDWMEVQSAKKFERAEKSAETKEAKKNKEIQSD